MQGEGSQSGLIKPRKEHMGRLAKRPRQGGETDNHTAIKNEKDESKNPNANVRFMDKIRNAVRPQLTVDQVAS